MQTETRERQSLEAGDDLVGLSRRRCANVSDYDFGLGAHAGFATSDMC